MTIKNIFFILIAFGFVFNAFSSTNDTIHILPFKKLKIYTDPKDGQNEFSQLGIFPSKKVNSRKINLHVTFQCPDGLHCGEWDYAGSIRIKNKKSKQSFEIARMMTPYGWYFDQNWKNTWTTDITDFEPFLHDSVEVEYIHYGYENANDRGWLVTLDFEMIEGNPIHEFVGFVDLWNGKMYYGDSLNSIENELGEIKIINSFNADFGRLKIIQTGHGMDEKENCAEFCPKTRIIRLNNKVIDQRKIWKKCGDNPLYPQAGTWIYDRANWCPGNSVNAENFDFNIKNQKEFKLDMDMEKYIHPKDSQAYYDISSYLFLYKDFCFQNDVSIDQIVSPSNENEFSRINPICSNPKVRIKNNGKAILKSIDLILSINGNEKTKYKWKGNLAQNDTTTISIPYLINIKDNHKKMTFVISKPNHKKDNYKQDNIASTFIEYPEFFPNDFVFELLTNDSSKYLSYTLKNSEGKVMTERNLNTLSPNTIYKDTFHLEERCYEFLFKDTLNVGLDFWAMPEAGYGHIRFFDLKGNVIKSFNSDFGSYEYFQFYTNSNYHFDSSKISYPLATLFPKLNNGNFKLDIVLAKTSEIKFKVIENNTNKLVYDYIKSNVKNEIIPFNLSQLQKGRYTLIIEIDGIESKRNFRIEK